MKLRTLPYDLSVCKVPSVTDTVLSLDFFFLCHTDEEVSLVCRTEDVPKDMSGVKEAWDNRG